MSATPEQLKRIAVLKTHHRKTDTEIAELFGLTRRTISLYKQSSEYAVILAATREEQVASARDQIAGLADTVVGTLYTLMTTAKSELVRYQSASTLGEWLHLDEVDAVVKDDDISEVRRLLAAQQAQTHSRVLPPPLPGGQLPVLDGSYTIDDQPPIMREEPPEERAELVRQPLPGGVKN
jgi:DNA-binding transcriptional regulator LsrR (DeoR family)